MIYFENISKSYSSGILFSKVNIVIKAGMRAGLVGKNGSGKTTLLRLMLGEEEPDIGNIKKEKSATIGYLPQEIITGTGRSILEEVLASFPEALDLENKLNQLSNDISNHPENNDLVRALGDIQNKYDSIGGWDLEKNAKIILSGLGFSEHQFIEPMETFSGGWRMRVALASILLQEPDILFLDEPTNHLDLEATIWLENFLNSWKGGLIVISHDRMFLDRSINYIIDIDLKQVTLFRGTYSDYVKDKSLRIEQQLNAFKNQQKEIKETERFIDRFRYKNTKAKQVQSRIKKLDKLNKIDIPYEDQSRIALSIPQPERSPQKVLQCIKVKKNYGDLVVFDDLNLIVDRNQKIGLVGANGAGKSTLLKMLAGVELVTDGLINYGSGVRVEYYAQHQLDILNPKETVFDSLKKISNGLGENEIRRYLGGFLFSGNDIEKLVKVLSGGEKARLALARTLINPSNILLLDEPTNHLDMASRNIVEKVLSDFKGCIICISHDRHFLNEVTNLTCEVEDGSIKAYEGNYEYYEWKKKKSFNGKKEIKKKNNVKKLKYKERKKIRNRAVWIAKRFQLIEKKISELEQDLNDPINISDAELLQKITEAIKKLENEYMDLIEEKENIDN